MGAQELKHITQEEYLKFERSATEKHEYFQGEIFAMSGASFEHNIIFKNSYLELGTKLKGKKCQPYGSDLRIHIPKNSLYTYPDISIVCGNLESADNKFDTAINPSVIFEILSKSTESYDRNQKFDLYRDISSLQEYIMIHSEKIQVIKYLRNADNSWLMTNYVSLEDSFIIQAVDVELKLADIYLDVKFSAEINEH